MKLKRSSEKEEGKKGRRGEREKNFLLRYYFFASILILVLLGMGCQPNQGILKDVPPPATPLSTAETKKTSFEQDVRDMQTAGFDYIFVFRRKDNGAFDDDDRKYLRKNTPLETNRWTKSEEGKAYIAGSGFAFLPEQMDALRDRFVVEDFSKPEIKDAANKAANTQTNQETKNSNKTEKMPVNKKEK